MQWDLSLRPISAYLYTYLCPSLCISTYLLSIPTHLCSSLSISTYLYLSLPILSVPVLSDWINLAMGVPPRADKPGKPLETVGMGITLSYKPSTSCTSTHTNSCPWYFSTAGIGHGTPIRQGVNCSEICKKSSQPEAGSVLKICYGQTDGRTNGRTYRTYP